jgi:hypothetical protein
MFSPQKIATIIEHISKRLETMESYMIACDLEDSELVELRKHFDVEVTDGFGDFEVRYIFKKK